MRFRTGTYLSKTILWLLLLASGLLVFTSQNSLDRMKAADGQQGELLYFPSARFTRAAAFGFTNLAADGIWLQMIQYYGQHSLSDREYKYLGHMFDLLTYLAPQFKMAYNFGALLLVSDARDPAGALKLLDKGISLNPEDWSIPFTKGFINYIFLSDYREAGRWFTISSRLAGAPEMAGRFAAFARKKGGDIYASRELWVEIYNKSRNQTEKEIAKMYIDQIDRQLIIDKLNSIVSAYRKEKGDWPKGLGEMVESGHLRHIPKDPLGGRFVLNKTRDSVMAVGGRDKKK
ncbi:MAG: hypothetical protein RDU76_08820 [Candidatus Edwardsbacteria bacterium]|nr:hypothetical protein [Candidatus Edwardsbacteria bacterium]